MNTWHNNITTLRTISVHADLMNSIDLSLRTSATATRLPMTLKRERFATCDVHMEWMQMYVQRAFKVREECSSAEERAAKSQTKQEKSRQKTQKQKKEAQHYEPQKERSREHIKNKSSKRQKQKQKPTIDHQISEWTHAPPHSQPQSQQQRGRRQGCVVAASMSCRRSNRSNAQCSAQPQQKRTRKRKRTQTKNLIEMKQSGRRG